MAERDEDSEREEQFEEDQPESEPTMEPKVPEMVPGQELGVVIEGESEGEPEPQAEPPEPAEPQLPQPMPMESKSKFPRVPTPKQSKGLPVLKPFIPGEPIPSSVFPFSDFKVDIRKTLDDLLAPEPWEDDDTFEARGRFSILLSYLPYPFNGLSAAHRDILGHLMIKKARFNLVFDPEVEKSLAAAIQGVNEILKEGSYEEIRASRGD